MKKSNGKPARRKAADADATKREVAAIEARQKASVAAALREIAKATGAPPSANPEVLYAEAPGRARMVAEWLLTLADEAERRGPCGADSLKLHKRIDAFWRLYLGNAPYLAARMQLIRCIEVVVEQGDQRYTPPQTAFIAHTCFRAFFPEYAHGVDADDIETAIKAWRRRGAPRKSEREPKKWAHLAAMMNRAGLHQPEKPVTTRSLTTEWTDWKKLNPLG